MFQNGDFAHYGSTGTYRYRYIRILFTDLNFFVAVQSCWYWCSLPLRYRVDQRPSLYNLEKRLGSELPKDWRGVGLLPADAVTAGWKVQSRAFGFRPRNYWSQFRSRSQLKMPCEWFDWADLMPNDRNIVQWSSASYFIIPMLNTTLI